MAEENVPIVYQIIPARDARSIHGIEVLFDGNETAIGDIQANQEDQDEYIIDIEDDEQEILEKEALIPVLMQIKQFKIHWLLFCTGNFTRENFQSKFGKVYLGIQIVIVSLLIVYTMFTFGLLVKATKWPTLITADGNLYFTKAHDVIWELKWLLTYIFGLFYMRTGHLGWFLSQLRLPRYLLKRAKRHGFCYALFVACMVIILPTTVHGFQMYARLKTTKLSSKLSNKDFHTIICTSVFFLFRLITVPSFCVVTSVLYLIKVLIESLGTTLQNVNVNLGIPYAKREVRAVKKIIRQTDTRFKWYLLLHLSLILLTAFTGLFSLLEKIEFKIAYSQINQTTSGSAPREIKLPNYQPVKFTSFQQELAKLHDNMESLRRNISILGNEGNTDTMYGNGNSEGLESIRVSRQKNMEEDLNALKERLQLLTLKSLMNSNTRSVFIEPAENRTVQTFQSASHFLIEFSRAEVLLTSLVELAEIIGLFLVPLLLLAWHERTLARIKDEFFDLDEEEQRRDLLLVDCEATKKAILPDLESMRGVSIFGLQISLYKAGFIAVLAPFMTATLHALFKQFKLY